MLAGAPASSSSSAGPCGHVSVERRGDRGAAGPARRTTAASGSSAASSAALRHRARAHAEAPDASGQRGAHRLAALDTAMLTVASASGSVKTKVAPRPASLSAQMRPPLRGRSRA
jgi:hypothetical protein